MLIDAVSRTWSTIVRAIDDRSPSHEHRAVGHQEHTDVHRGAAALQDRADGPEPDAYPVDWAARADVSFVSSDIEQGRHDPSDPDAAPIGW